MGSRTPLPDRVGLLTGTYVTLMSISASVPPLIAAPLAESAGWRVTIGAWAVLAVGARVEQCDQWTIFGVQRTRDNPVTATAVNCHH